MWQNMAVMLVSTNRVTSYWWQNIIIIKEIFIRNIWIFEFIDVIATATLFYPISIHFILLHFTLFRSKSSDSIYLLINHRFSLFFPFSLPLMIPPSHTTAAPSNSNYSYYYHFHLQLTTTVIYDRIFLPKAL